MTTTKLEWWRQARFGLFIHYGLYSQLGRGGWVPFGEKIPVAEYEKLRAVGRRIRQEGWPAALAEVRAT